jgi:serralysin
LIRASLGYATLRADLIKAVPGFFNNSNLPDVTSINGHSSFAIASTQERIFGILPATNSTNNVDGSVGIGTGFSAGLVRISALLHEIGHALGRVPHTIDGAPDALALWRFTSVGNHLFTGVEVLSAPAYFSLDGGVTNLADWGQTSDPSDFINNLKTGIDPFNESVGNLGNLTNLDKLITQALGFSATSKGNISPVAIQNDYFGITRLALPLDQATTVANAINAGAKAKRVM